LTISPDLLNELKSSEPLTRVLIQRMFVEIPVANNFDEAKPFYLTRAPWRPKKLAEGIQGAFVSDGEKPAR
jgi:hypothetical protein